MMDKDAIETIPGARRIPSVGDLPRSYQKHHALYRSSG